MEAVGEDDPLEPLPSAPSLCAGGSAGGGICASPRAVPPAPRVVDTGLPFGVEALFSRTISPTLPLTLTYRFPQTPHVPAGSLLQTFGKTVFPVEATLGNWGGEWRGGEERGGEGREGRKEGSNATV